MSSQAIDAVEVRLMLQPLQGTVGDREHSAARSEAETPPRSERKADNKMLETIKHLNNRIANLKGKGKGEVSQRRQSGGDNRSRSPPLKSRAGKSSQKGPGQIKMPKEMLQKDCVAMTEDGEPLCFSYQFGNCDKAGKGERCPKGWHL